MQQFLKPARGAARTRVVTTELFAQLLVAVDNTPASFDLRLGWKSPTPLAGALEKRDRPDVDGDA
jgi:hypothetical protein